MIKKIKWLILVAFVNLGLFLSCSSEDTTQVQVRIKNSTNYDLFDINIGVGNCSLEYDLISIGLVSDFEFCDYAYKSIYYKLKINDEFFSQIPIDHVGEKKLKPGNYTFEFYLFSLDNYGNKGIGYKLIREN